MENTSKNYQYTIEGKSFNSSDENLMAKVILELAKEKGILAAQDAINSLTLKGKDRVYSGDDRVDLSQENNFSLGVKGYTFKVNGVEIETRQEKLIALDILELAKKKDAIEGKPSDYALKSLSGEETYKPEDWVQIEEGKEFLAVPQGSTPVAQGEN